MSGGTNYAARGEHAAYSEQARDAALRRYALLHNLGMDARRLAETPDKAPDAEALTLALADIVAADGEMRAALSRANEAALLCGKPQTGVQALLQGR